MHSSLFFLFIVERGCSMATKEEKKDRIREQITAASCVYRDNLAGKVFLYVIGEEYFEVIFHTNRFLHLTGVNSKLGAREFYEKAKANKLTVQQFFFDSTHPYHGAKSKLPCLMLLPVLTSSLVCVVKDLRTLTFTYRIGVTNIDFTLGLTENLDFNGNKINDWFLPRTLRVKDRAIEESNDAEFVDFIFSKDASAKEYDVVTYADENKKFPSSIKPLLSNALAKNCT